MWFFLWVIIDLAIFYYKVCEPIVLTIHEFFPLTCALTHDMIGGLHDHEHDCAIKSRSLNHFTNVLIIVKSSMFLFPVFSKGIKIFLAYIREVLVKHLDSFLERWRAIFLILSLVLHIFLMPHYEGASPFSAILFYLFICKFFFCILILMGLENSFLLF